MAYLKLVKTIEVLEDGKISAILFDNSEVYLQPIIEVDTLDSLGRLRVRSEHNIVIEIDTTIQQIGGVSFSGTFEQLETAIRELAKDANSINYNGGSFPAGASTEAKQDTQITALSNLLTELQLKADLSETQPISASSLPLPSGASTEATQLLLLELTTFANWELTVGNNIDLVYYAGVEAGNPSGNIYNVKNRVYKQSATTITTIIYTYDSLDRIINIGN